MRIVTQTEAIKESRDRWLRQYANYADTHAFPDGTRVGDIRAALHKLNAATCSAEEAARAFTNRSWSDNNCDECGNSAAVLVRIGQEPDYDVRWQDVCLECITKAADLLRKQGERSHVRDLVE
jgi:hypothetical protein